MPTRRLFVWCAAVAALSGRSLAHVDPGAGAPRAPQAAACEPQASRTLVDIEMKNVRLHLSDDLVLDVRHLRGTMVPRAGGVPVFDDQRSYVLHVATADVSMNVSSLEALFNRYVLATPHAALKNVRLGVDGTRLAITGTLRKGIAVPFAAKASAAADGGNLRLHTESIKAAGVPVKGLMGLFGLELDDLVDLKRRAGIDIQDNDIVIAPGQVLPPPAIEGYLTRAQVTPQGIVQTFGCTGELPRLSPPSPGARNYVYFGHGVIRFGKLTMSDADLQLIDQDPKDPFDFFPARYAAQLVAGYSKNTRSGGLRTYMPDYADLRATAR